MKAALQSREQFEALAKAADYSHVEMHSYPQDAQTAKVCSFLAFQCALYRVCCNSWDSRASQVVACTLGALQLCSVRELSWASA